MTFKDFKNRLNLFARNFKKHLKRFFTIKNILLTIFVIFFLVQYLQIQSIFGTFSFLQGRDTSLITEIGQIKEAYVKYGQDLNEMRDFLRLPNKNYSDLQENTNSGEDDENKNEVQLSLFKYIDYLASQKKIENNLSLHNTFLKNLSALPDFNNSQITENSDTASLSLKTTDGEIIANLILTKDDGLLFLKTLKSVEQISAKNFEEFHEQINKFIKEKKDSLLENLAKIKQLKTEIETAINSPEIQTEISKLGINLKTKYLENDFQLAYPIYNKTNEIIGEIILNTAKLHVYLIDKKDSSISIEATDISSALLPFLQKLNTKTLIEKKASDAEKSLADTLLDKGFQLLLKEAGLKIAEKVREDNSRIYYDILDEDGTKIGSIVLEKATGVINIVDQSGNNAQNILFFAPDSKKKILALPEKIPQYTKNLSHKPNTFNILIAGKNGNLLDTMIFAHINEDTRKIKMVSIPRDLFYNGRKINSFAYYYGMSELKRVLSEITGYKLDKYILIDMYAFIDVINLIGGIDIHLDRTLVDPFYKTIDNGVEGTLHYEAGDYHLGGKEALRIARSRKTSSDFSRAERQQMILKALQNKARNLGFGDADTIYEIAKTVLGKTETDISLNEAIAYYFRYQNFEIESNIVISSGNILYVPPYISVEDCQKMMDEALAAGALLPTCEDAEHAYTLLPKNDNWDVIKWFFREQFE